MNCLWMVDGEQYPSQIEDVHWSPHSEPQKPTSINLYCNKCGDIWARIIMQPELSHYRLMERKCLKHNHGLLTIRSLNGAYLNSLPNVLLKREYLIAEDLSRQGTWESNHNLRETYH